MVVINHHVGTDSQGGSVALSEEVRRLLVSEDPGSGARNLWLSFPCTFFLPLLVHCFGNFGTESKRPFLRHMCSPPHSGFPPIMAPLVSRGVIKRCMTSRDIAFCDTVLCTMRHCVSYIPIQAFLLSSFRLIWWSSFAAKFSY